MSFFEKFNKDLILEISEKLNVIDKKTFSNYLDGVNLGEINYIDINLEKTISVNALDSYIVYCHKCNEKTDITVYESIFTCICKKCKCMFTICENNKCRKKLSAEETMQICISKKLSPESRITKTFIMQIIGYNYQEKHSENTLTKSSYNTRGSNMLDILKPKNRNNFYMKCPNCENKKYIGLSKNYVGLFEQFKNR